MTGRGRTGRRQGGQSALELAGVVLFLLLLLMTCLQLVALVAAGWSAERAARAAVRAEAAGSDPVTAAGSSLEDWLRAGARVDTGPGAAEVTVRVPALLPGLPDRARTVRRQVAVGSG